MDLSELQEGVSKRLLKICQAVALDLDLKIYDLDYLSKHHLLRVFIYNVDNNVTLEDCADLDKALTPHLEDSCDLPETGFTLEVSTPGVYRNLKNINHFKMAQGEYISLELLKSDKLESLPQTAINGKKVRGKLMKVDNNGVLLEVLSNIIDGTIYFEFSLIRNAKVDPDLLSLIDVKERLR